MRFLGTPLLVKGLEFDHAVVMYPEDMTARELYVAITRGSKSLTIVSKSRVIMPKEAITSRSESDTQDIIE